MFPNIPGQIGIIDGGHLGYGAFDVGEYKAEHIIAQASGEMRTGLSLDASRVSDKYGDSDTVQPESLKVLLLVRF